MIGLIWTISWKIGRKESEETDTGETDIYADIKISLIEMRKWGNPYSRRLQI